MQNQARRRPDRCTKRRGLLLESLEERRLLTVLTVDTYQDVVDAADGLTSLREAVVTANELPGADHIVFDFGNDGPATIRLEHGELQLTEAVSITSPGPELLIIDAQQQSRIINITASEGDFAIEGLTLTNGQVSVPAAGHDDTTFNGGAVRSITSGSLVIQNSSVTNNFLTEEVGSVLKGGGVFALGDVTVGNSTISGCTGGGISSSGNVTVRTSTIEGNSGSGISAQNVTVSSSTVSGNSGRGVGGGNVTVTGSTISGNSGGGVFGRNVTVGSSTISGNSARGGYGRGGGITADNVTVSSSTITGNSAKYDGGISVSGYQGNVTITNSILAGNEDKGGGSDLNYNLEGLTGGGIRGGNVTVISSTISGNSASGQGGGIFADNVTINSSTISGNSAAEDGGGISSYGSDVTITNSIVAGNSGAASDLGRYGRFPPTLTIQNSLIGNNRGTDLSEAPVGSPDGNGNVVGGPVVVGDIDPLLGPLTDNGGPTFTHALLPGSPAINMGDPAAMAGSSDVPGFDQRDAPHSRIVDGRIDMGAFERGIDGDTNGDSKVDFTDFLVLAANFGTGQGWSEGNFDGSEDGTRFADFLALSANFGREEPSSGEVSIARRPAAVKSGMSLDLNADHSRRQAELVDDLLAGDLHEWLSEL